MPFLSKTAQFMPTWPTRAQVAHVRLEAAQRALALFQALGNLHCFEAARCAPDMRLAFARMLAAQLRRTAAAGESCKCMPGNPPLLAAAISSSVARLHM